MPAPLEYWLAFVVGLTLSLHCVGMCGGFVMAYSTASVAAGRTRLLGLHALFNAGRFVTFTTMGALAGLVGSMVDLAAETRGIQGVAASVAGVLMVFYGLSYLGAFPGLRLQSEEAVAETSWFRRALIGALRSRSPLKPLALGALVGFLPCGALWGMLIFAAKTASPLAGWGILAAYWAGTTPALFGVGQISARLGQAARQRSRAAAACILIAAGAWAVYRGLNGAGWL